MTAEPKGLAAHFDLSGVTLRLRGLTAEVAALFEERWGRYASRPAADPAVDVVVEAPSATAGLPERSLAAWAADFSGSRASYRMVEGELEADTAGTAVLRARPAPPRQAFFDLINLLLPALAWVLPSRGILLLHGAGVVLDGRAHVLIGSSGAGKTTWTRLAQQGGAAALSDDLVFVRAGDEGARALSLPFRADRQRPLAPGDWPVPAVLFPAHGTPARIEPLNRVTAMGRLTANLPYVAGALPDESRIARGLERLLAAAPPATLTFPRDPSFVELLRSHRTG